MTEIIREDGIFHLRNDHISYILKVLPGGFVAHLYFGSRLTRLNPKGILEHMGVPGDGTFSPQGCMLDRLSREYPTFGLGDMRPGTLEAVGKDGTGAVDLKFVKATVESEKPRLEGLPATFGGDSATLILTLRDDLTGLEADLSYTIFDDCDVVTRSVRIRNTGEDPVTLTRALSLCLDLPDDDWDLVTLNGAWARERQIVRRHLVPGFQGTGTRCGASSLQTSPFAALARPRADEEAGEVIGAALIYSGNFEASVTVSQYGIPRLLMGINPDGFAWRLTPGACFQAPETVLVYSREGLNGMSHTFHHLWREHLLPSRWVHTPRPVLLNSWEAAYFDFDEDKLVAIARAAAQAGVDLFVVDDGWFGRRDDDTTSLGDWSPDLKKLPGGIARLAEKVRAEGVAFGIWMEPEMVSPDSDLYRAHPDWCIHVKGRESITARHQLILDLSRPEVEEYVYAAIARTLTDSKAAYLKWDMNRNFSNIGSAALPPDRMAELPHRYILGLYRVLDRVTKAFPDVLIEGCASGGGRFDPGMLYYVPQFWCSDNTDALSRCRIQYGTSLYIPPSAMGSHVSAVPNHQTGRVTPMQTRFAVALSGCFGYELDPRALGEEDRNAMRGQIAFAKETAELRLNGRLYRILSPFDGNDTAFLTVSEDRRQALFVLVQERARVNELPMLVKLRGLDGALRYRIGDTGAVLGGDELMASGLSCEGGKGDVSSLMLLLKAEEV